MKKLLLILTVLLFFAAPGWGADLCYSVSGADGNSGSCTTPVADNFRKSLDKLITDFEAGSAGDRFLLLEGDTWNYNNPSSEWSATVLNITTSGASDGSRKLIGACDSTGAYVATSAAVDRPVLDHENYYSGTGYNKAIFINNDTSGVKWITLENLHFYNTGGQYLEVDKSDSDYNEGIIIQKFELHKTYREGISMEDCRDCLVTQFEAYDMARINGPDCKTPDKEFCTSSARCTNLGNTGILLQRQNRNTVVSHADIYDTYGECVGVFRDGAGYGYPVIVEYTRTYNCRSANLHATDSDVIFRYNIAGAYDLYGNGRQPTWYGGTWDSDETDSIDDNDSDGCSTRSSLSGGIPVNNAAGGDTGGAITNRYIIFNNTVFGQGHACINCSYAGSNDGDTLYCLVFNNTMIDCAGVAGNAIIMNDLDDIGGTTSEVRGNIIDHQDVSPVGGLCNASGGEAIFSDNLWDGTPTANCQGSGDLNNTSGVATAPDYYWPTTRTTITMQNFNPTQGSPGLANGNATVCSNADYDEAFGNTTDFSGDPSVTQFTPGLISRVSQCDMGAFSFEPSGDGVPNKGEICCGATLQ